MTVHGNNAGDALFSLLEELLGNSGDPLAGIAHDSFASWWKSVQPHLRADASPFELAVRCGFHSDRVGYAFAGGYQGALQSMLPALGSGNLGAVCVTEEGGGHPRAIETRLEPSGEGKFRLSGRKKFVTLGLDARVLLVAAVRALREDGRKDIVMVRVAADAPGVKLVEMGELPFVPEIGHAAVELDKVAVGEGDLLPGDGYERYIKPFRTHEDIHVHAALLGYLLGVARRAGWPDEERAKLASLVGGLFAVRQGNAAAPAVHVTLGGFLSLSTAVIGGLDTLWNTVEADERARWERDRALFQVAGKARAQRFLTAWERLRSAG